MLEEILKHNHLGKEEEYKFLLFSVFSSGKAQRESDLITFSQSSLYSIGFSIEAILSVLKYMSFVSVEEDMICLNRNVFDPSHHSSKSYFQQDGFYSVLYSKLEEDCCLTGIFNEDTLRFSKSTNQYYVKASIVDFKYYPLRNLLKALGFFQRGEEYMDHLYIRSSLTPFFQTSVLQTLEKESKKRRITLNQIRQSNTRKEELGREAEEFALKFEIQRLLGSRNLDQVQIISEEFANAGYDIQSYNEIDSVIIDRYIEVKSFSGEISFYWSENEIEVSKELRSKYYLYLINRDHISSEGYTPKIFQDPYKRVFENQDWQRQVQSWHFKLLD